jgi:DNA repair exonuclease SbcCD nuclease subunit
LKFVHTADTHLGFEVLKVAASDSRGRQRRADSILGNFLKVIDHALETGADLFIHSGDLFNKFYIPRERLDDLVQPFRRLSKAGIPVVIIPGNHERSEFPFDLFHGLPGIYVFDRPKSLHLHVDGYSVGVAGFPFIREDSKRTFLKALDDTGYDELQCDLNILVVHQTFDEATVGPGDYTFRLGRPDTVAKDTVPTDFAYIAAGHIHRYQILPHPLKPQIGFVYPGSTQRMSFAEMDEEKGFVEGEVLHDRVETRFVPLPSWDMEIVEIEAAGLSASEMEKAIQSQFWRFSEDLVIRFNLTGGATKKDYPEIDFDKLRAEMPPVLECQFAIRAGKRWIAK